MMMRMVCGFWMAMMVVPVIQAQEIVLTYRPYSDQDVRYRYPEELLRLVIARTEEKYGAAIVVQSDFSFSRDRTKLEIEKGQYLHVIAEAPKPGWEEDLLPIRIPIRKGIQGYRLFLIHKDNADALKQVRTLEELKTFSTGSGAQWSTQAVMEQAGFDVVVGASYEGLFQMLEIGRFVTFGRGVNEIFDEYDAQKDMFPDLRIEETLALYIPLPTYFFVTPTRPELAHRIEEGLLAMITDGSFDTFFLQYHQQMIDKAQLSQRRIFRLPNPNLSNETPLMNSQFWYFPSQS
ncbi:MAG: hypothetical protein ABID63_06660 [Pseudomonadota bacterium]